MKQLKLKIKPYRYLYLVGTCIVILGVTLSACQNTNTKETSKATEPKVEKSRVETSRVENLPYYNDPTFTPKWLTSKSPELVDFHQIPDFKLINQQGDTIGNETFQDKIYVADFFFTTCAGICPKMTTNMSKVQEAFKDDNEVLLLSHSVMPTYDTPSVLQKYAQNKGVVATKWHLATGDRKQIYDLGRNQYFVEEDLGREKAPDDFLHTENFVLIDKNRHIRGIYNGIHNASVRQLITDIEALKKE